MKMSSVLRHDTNTDYTLMEKKEKRESLFFLFTPMY